MEAVIREHIRTGRPVGSRTVSRKEDINLGPATVRNTMADLEEKELLFQPHTSAGRLPTLMGLRLYLQSFLTLEKLPSRERDTIRDLLTNSGPDFNDTLRNASRVLSSFSRQVAMVMSPSQASAVWRQIDFVLLKPGLVMSVLVFKGGLISNRVIKTDEKLTTDELIRFGNYLNDHFQGKTVAEIRSRIVKQLQQVRNNFEDLYHQALTLARDACQDCPESQLFVGGTTNALDHENVNMSEMRELFALLEEKSKLLNLLDKTIQAKDMRVTFPQDYGLNNLSNYGFISSPYGPEGKALGTVGVIGPVSMNYPRLIPTVDLVARILTQLFQKNS